jgi:hypothetical protein
VRQIRDGINTERKAMSHPTIFHEVLNNAELPEDEKTDARLGDEAQLIVEAGLITTSRVSRPAVRLAPAQKGALPLWRRA